jgi:hypothetical protein
VTTSAARRARFSRRRPGRKTENLKNWKPDVLPGVPAFQDFRFSGFQVSTHPKMHDLVAGEGLLNGWLRAELPFPGDGKHRRCSVHDRR